MAKILFIWNNALTDGNIGSYRPSVYAAESIGYDIDTAMKKAYGAACLSLRQHYPQAVFNRF